MSRGSSAAGTICVAGGLRDVGSGSVSMPSTVATSSVDGSSIPSPVRLAGRNTTPACQRTATPDPRTLRHGCAAISRPASAAGTASEEFEPLDLFAAEHPRVLELFEGLDPFRDHAHPERVRQRDDRADQSDAVVAAADAADKQSIHLHGVDLQLVQVAGRSARSRSRRDSTQCPVAARSRVSCADGMSPRKALSVISSFSRDEIPCGFPQDRRDLAGELDVRELPGGDVHADDGRRGRAEAGLPLGHLAARHFQRELANSPVRPSLRRAG